MREVDWMIKERIDGIKTEIAELENEIETIRKKIKEVRKGLHDITVEDLWIRIYSVNALKQNGVVTVGQLIELGEQELMRMPRISTVTINDIKDELSALGWNLPYKSEVK